jgi:hypothetical protein
MSHSIKVVVFLDQLWWWYLNLSCIIFCFHRPKCSIWGGGIFPNFEMGLIRLITHLYWVKWDFPLIHNFRVYDESSLYNVG